MNEENKTFEQNLRRLEEIVRATYFKAALYGQEKN